MDHLYKQKEVSGAFATHVWIASGIFLYVTSESAPLWWAFLFVLGGMFIAAAVFGVAFYLLQRGITKALVLVVKRPSLRAATAIYSLGLMLMAVEAVVIYLAARWTFQLIT